MRATARPLARGLLDAFIQLCSVIVCAAFLAPGLASKVSSHRTGTGFAFDNVQDFGAMQELSWWYDWGTEPRTEAREFAEKHGIEYVPMQWANWGIEDLINSPALEDASSLLGFNEPNHREQANLDPSEAARLWNYLEEAADKFGLRLGSPSAAPCGVDCVTPNPFDWWDQFFAACSGCRVDFLAVHIYSCNGEAVGWFLNDCRKYGLPVWVTEFACPIGPGQHEVSQELFMASAVDQMQAAGMIERYAWFAPRVGGGWVGESASLLQPERSALSKLGELYLRPPAASNRSGSVPGFANVVTSSWTAQCSACWQEGRLQECSGSQALPQSFCAHCLLTCGFKPSD